MILFRTDAVFFAVSYVVVFLLGPVFYIFLLHLTIEIVVFYTTAGQMLMVVCRAEQLLSLL